MKLNIADGRCCFSLGASVLTWMLVSVASFGLPVLISKLVSHEFVRIRVYTAVIRLRIKVSIFGGRVSLTSQ